MVFALGLGLLLQRPILHPIILISFLVLLLTALLLSMSRGGWIAVFCASGLMLFLFSLTAKPAKWKVSVVVLLFLLVAALSFLGSNPMMDRLETLNDPAEPNLALFRFPAWSGCLQIIRENPWWGTGPGTFPWSFTQVRPAGLGYRFREAHNDYLQVQTEMGLTVLIPLLWGLAVLVGTAVKRLKYGKESPGMGLTLGAFGGVVALLVHSVSDFNIQITSNGILFSLLIGLILSGDETRRQDGQVQG